MLQTLATETKGGLYELETSEKLHGAIQRKAGLNYSEALRLHMIWTRMYIVEKLAAYAMQRRKAYLQVGLKSEAERATKLFNLMVDYSSLSLSKLRRLVMAYERHFIAIAPPAHSRQFNHYNTTIRSILADCRQQEGMVE